jgi:hypothetical protein
MSRFLRGVLVAIAVGCPAAALAEDSYYSVPLADLQLTEGKVPTANLAPDWRRAVRQPRANTPYAVLDGPGEAYIVGVEDSRAPWDMDILWPGDPTAPIRIFIRAPAGKDVAGRLFFPAYGGTGLVKFRVGVSQASPDARNNFHRAKVAYYDHLLGRDIPGAAWFRHQAREAGLTLKLPPEQADRMPPWQRGRTNELSQTYDLFTGGRAMSENLHLDRVLPRVAPNETPVKLDSIQGITIQEINWEPLVKDLKPKLDPLAPCIPADQHVVFFPTFRAAMAVSDETKLHDTPLLHLAEPRAENARIADRYQQQLGLPLSTVARILGPSVVRSAALTGSDTFFATGTDVAVVFETPQPAVLENLLFMRVALAVKPNVQVKAEQGQIAGLAYRGFRTPDRRVSSYLAKLDKAVIVTNSLEQIKRLADVRNGKCKSIASLPEYTFFRDRYRLGDPEESALVFLSDATIRRWCGPRWRIADSRRTRTAAVMAEIEASQLDELVNKQVQPGPVYTDLPLADAGQLTMTPAGVVSSTAGSLEFLTPISEMPLEEVTKAEADAYARWRDGYQRNWTWAFDPIAVRIGVHKDRLSGDMTVMPLIWGTEYREFVSISRGGKLAPDAGDPHEALLHAIIALNHKSPWFDRAENFTRLLVKGVSLGWIGDSAAVYVEEDPFWDDLAKVKPQEVNRFMEGNVGRLPVALRVESSNSLKLAMFLSGLRAYVEETSPGLVRWESLKYKDRPYVKVSPTERDGRRMLPLENTALYYTTSPDALTVTLSEKVLQRAIDRQLAREEAGGEKKPAGAAETKPTGKPAQDLRPWLGSNVGLQVDSKVLEIVNHLARDEYQQTMQLRAWGNIPILNEWKRRFPNRDPVAVHQQVWQVELVCPGGGKYVWNEKWQTMESTVYGHPGEPKQGPPAPPVLSSFRDGNFGLTVEEQGLRARVILRRGTQVQSPGAATPGL